MRWFFRILLLLILLTAVYVGTAVASLTGLVEDARKGDVAAVMSRVDLRRLRNSLADQIVRAHFSRIQQTRQVKTIERIAAPTVIDAVIAKLLTPENIANVLQSGVLQAPSGDGPAITLPSLSSAGLDDTARALTRLRPKSPMQLQVLLDDTGETAIRMRYQGTHWKLSGLDLPPAALERLVAGISVR